MTPRNVQRDLRAPAPDRRRVPRGGRRAADARSRRALLVLDSWAGRTRTEVEVVAFTRRGVTIRAIADTRLAGRARVLLAGRTATVPLRALVFLPAVPR